MGYTKFYGQAGGGSIPRIVVGGLAIRTGEGVKAQEVFDLLEEATGMKPVER